MSRVPLCLASLLLLVSLAPRIEAQSVSALNPNENTDLKLALVFSRHGVRSPTKANDAYNPYAIQPFPDWPVAPGQLTPHGKQLMTIFGDYYRRYFTAQNLFSGDANADLTSTYIYADNSQRTLDSAAGLAGGLFPDAGAVVHFQTGGSDALFYPVKANLGKPDITLAASALAGRIGANSGALAQAYGAQLGLLEGVLLNRPSSIDFTYAPSFVTSLGALPITVTPGSGGSIVGFDGSVDLASTMAEIFILEYCEGMTSGRIGWGRLTPDTISEIAKLHIIDFDLTDRTPFLAQAQGSNLLLHIINTLTQAATQTATPQAIGPVGEKLVMLVGHDNQIASVGGLLRADWQLPSFAQDDTPPGGAMVFELRQSRSDGSYVVRVYYTSQTMDQMHNATPLTLDAGPGVAPIFIPNASTATPTFDAPLDAFVKFVNGAINRNFTN